jgi:hypothetical protein
MGVKRLQPYTFKISTTIWSLLVDAAASTFIAMPTPLIFWLFDLRYTQQLAAHGTAVTILIGIFLQPHTHDRRFSKPKSIT